MAVLVAVAITGVIAMVLASLYENMNELMLRANVTAEADNLQRYVQGVLSQQVLCKNALVQNDGTIAQVPGDGARTQLLKIQIDNDLAVAPPPVDAVARGAMLNSNLSVNNIYLRNRDQNQNNDSDDNQDFVDTTVNSAPARTYRLEAVLEFQMAGRLLGGSALRPRAIPLVATALNSDNRILFCDYSDPSLNPAHRCDVADCPPVLNDDGEPCTLISFVIGIDNDGKVKCGCRPLHCPRDGTPGTPSTSPGTTPPAPTN